MRRHLGADGLAWAEPRLDALGALMGGPIAQRAEETDRNPPRLERYDRWGRDVSVVVMPPTFEASRQDLIANSFSSAAFRDEARRAGVDPAPLAAAWAYLLDQAEIGMMCALGTGGDMVVRLAEEFAPPEVRDRVREIFAAGELAGEAAQMLTERTGGSDLAVAGDDRRRPTATRGGSAGSSGSRRTPTARPSSCWPRRRAAPTASGTSRPFLVLRERRDGVPQRRAHPPAEGQARHQGGGVGRGGAARRRGVPAGAEGPTRPAGPAMRRQRRGRRRPGPGPDDGAHQRGPARHRHDGPRVRPAAPWSRRSATPTPARRSAPSCPTTR